MAEKTGKKIVGIYCSPRQGGNTDTLLDAALKGAEDAGAAVQRVYLRDLQFVPCQNCPVCRTEGVCEIKDDMTVVYEALDNNDVIVLAAPVYFASLCAQAKAMIDRCQPYWVRKYVLKQPPRRKDHAGGFISCGAYPDDRFLACTDQIVKTWFLIMRVEYRGCLFVPGMDAPDDAAKHRTAITNAIEYGKRLVGSSEPR